MLYCNVHYAYNSVAFLSPPELPFYGPSLAVKPTVLMSV